MIPFISHEDLGAYLETTLNGSDLMTLIALDGACESVRRYMHRKLNLAADEDIVLDGNSTSALILPERPAHEVSDVTINGDAVDDASLYLEIERGVLWLVDGSVWTRGKGSVALTYTHGYSLDEDGVTGTIERVPANIRLVALKLAAGVWRSKGSTAAAAGALTGEHIGSYQYSQDVAKATALATTFLTPEDMVMLEGQRDVFAA